MARLSHACRCGKVAFAIEVPHRRAGTRVTCFCKDCQTAGRLFGAEAEILGPAGGTDIYQTTPDRLSILRGAEHLQIIRLSPKGLMRWHAACCNTPVLNTAERIALPFVGLVLRPDERAAADAVLGPVTAYVFTASARPGAGAPAADRGFARTGMAIAGRMLGAWVRGKAGRNPLRTPEGGPIAPIRILTPEERRAARPV